jgi:hypothetical protein
MIGQNRRNCRTWQWCTVLTLVTVLLVCAAREAITSGTIGSDFLCFWAAGEIIASGKSPYDTQTQARVQQHYGWDKTRDGLGIYDFLPYYYPPWIGLVCVLLVPLGYTTARLVWFALIIEATFLSGYLLRDAVAASRWIPLVVVPVFLFTVISVLMGQPVMLMFFLMVVAWRLLEGRRDFLAGSVLVWLTHKPQLSVVLILAILVWSARQGRWRVAGGFLSTLGILSLASALVIPTWPLQMLAAAREIPPPTDYFPWIGTSWLLTLETLELPRWAIWGAYLPVALAFLAATIWAAVRKETPLSDLLSLSVLAAFFVAPYARHYDFPMLLFPLLVLLGRLPPIAETVVLVAAVLLPYVQVIVLAHLKEMYGPVFKLHGEITFFWVPALLTIVWLLGAKGPRGAARPTSAGSAGVTT